MRSTTIKFLMLAGGVLLGVVLTQSAWAQRGRGGGIRGGGGGGARASAHRAPSASRSRASGPAMSRPQARPATANRSLPSRPNANAGASQIRRPSGNLSRPDLSQRPSASKPKLPQRPSASKPNLASRPGQGGGIQRPGSGLSGQRPGNQRSGGQRLGGQAGDRVSSSQLNDFLGNKPSSSSISDRLGDRDSSRLGDGKLGDGNLRDRPLGDGGGRDGDRNPLADRRPGTERNPLRDRDGDQTKIGQIGSRDVNVGNVNIGNSVDFSKDSKAWVNNQHDVGNRVRNNASDRYYAPYRSGAYRHGVVGGYPYYNGWGSRGNYYGWRAPTAAAFGAFLGASWGNRTPIYYGYGTGGNVYYEQNTVYVDGTPAGTPEEYAQQAIDFAAAAPAPAQTEEEEWLPLGVFALTQEDLDDSQTMIEMAVNKDAVLAGTYYNEATDTSRSLKGTIDQKSQRAVLGFADGKNPEVVLEMGMANLTDDEVPALLHRGTEESQPVLLVRLEEPEDAQ